MVYNVDMDQGVSHSVCLAMFLWWHGLNILEENERNFIIFSFIQVGLHDTISMGKTNESQREVGEIYWDQIV